jgi:hypothetical protein
MELMQVVSDLGFGAAQPPRWSTNYPSGAAALDGHFLAAKARELLE